MKQILLVTFLWAVILLPESSFAQTDTAGYKKDTSMQKIKFGVKVGLNMQSTSGKVMDNDFNPGIVGGLMLGMHKKKIGVRAEVLVHTSTYSSSTIIDSATGKKDVFNALSIDIPLLFEYSFISMLKVQIGPQYTNMISVKSKEGLIGDPKVFFKAREFSGVLGLEATFPMHISAGARYIYGLSNINNGVINPSESDKWQNQTIQIYAGYRFQ